jgi:hypothetical protein
MANYTVTLTAVQEKALLGDMVSIQDWIDNSINNKARKMINRYVEQSGLGSRHSTDDQKATIITDMTIETATARNARLRADD